MIATQLSLPLLTAQVIATSAMFGVIWMVQLVTYPQFAEIPSDRFTDYHASYSSRITWIVAPLMLVELATALAASILFWNSPLRGVAVCGLLLVGLIWASTTFIQVPLHNKLANGFNTEMIETLVRGNWIRTILWTLRIVVVWLIFFRWFSLCSG